MTINDWLNGLMNIDDLNQKSFRVECEHYNWPELSELFPEPKKSIFTRFYENCRSKSENFCVGWFKKLAEYCKE